jgi:hypothetical protein
MTSQELEAACSSFVNELGLDPSLCLPDLFPESGGSGGSSSYAIEPKPGVILVVDPKLWNCGLGIYVVPGSRCPKRTRGNGVLGILGGEPPSGPPPRPSALGQQRQDSRPGSRKRCVLAQMTLDEAHDALRYLRELLDRRSAWGPYGNLLDVGDLPYEGWLWFTKEVQDVLDERFPDKWANSLYYLNKLRVGWELTKNEVEKNLKSPACDSGHNSGKGKS